MKKSTLFPLALVLSLLLTACGNPAAAPSESGTPTHDSAETNTSFPESSTDTVPSDLFTDRDFRTEYDTGDAIPILLEGQTASCASNAVQISGSTVTITGEGTYVLTGTLEEGMIVVDINKSEKVQLVLDGVSIHSSTSAPMFIRQADKVFLTLAEGSENTLSGGETFADSEETGIDAVIFSKEDLTLNGTGSLTITAPGGHGIVSKDELTVTGGSYTISAASHGIAGKDNLCIAAGTFTITSGKDGLHAENNDDESLGFLHISDGSFVIRADGDGISAAATMELLGGTYDLTTGGGSANGEEKTSAGWGGFPGGPGGFPGQSAAQEETDSVSTKGLKASGGLTIRGGIFRIDSADDAVHSNAGITLENGSFELSSGDDAFHADDTLTVLGGTVHIAGSYEGMEALHIAISGGDITLTATDDGLNAAGGTDQSGFGGRGDDAFGGRGGRGPGGMGGMSGSSEGSIVISGGTLHINASGDGIDANGTLEITGGFTTVCGPTQGDTATLDYDLSAVIRGGTFIGTGAMGMAQTFSDSEQGVFAVNVRNQSAGTQITLTDAAGKTLLTHTPELPFAVVILSSPDIVKGESYTITVGEASGTFAAG